MRVEVEVVASRWRAKSFFHFHSYICERGFQKTSAFRLISNDENSAKTYGFYSGSVFDYLGKLHF